jgi:hypothetical protein
MRVLATQSDVSQYITVLLCSVAYWLRHEAGAVKQVLPSALTGVLAQAVDAGEEFCRQHRVPVKNYRSYVKLLIAAQPPSGVMDNALDAHLADLRQALPSIKQNHSISDVALITLNRLRLWHRNGSPSTLEAVRSSLTQLGLPAILVNAFRTDTADISPLVKALQNIVKRLTGAAGLNVPLNQIPTLRDRYPGIWAEYLEIKRDINIAYKTTLRDWVRDQGGQVSVDAARKHFDSIGMPHRLPRGFKGLIGETGNLFTEDGAELKTYNGGTVTQVDPQAVIEMNPKYDPKLDNVTGVKGNWVFKATLTTTRAKDGEPNVQYYYTGNRILKNREHKFGLVDKLIAKETRMVASWRRDLKAHPADRKIMAAQCEIIYETCARVGGKDAMNRTGSTFGLTTLTVGHVRTVGQTLILEYEGKDSARQKHVLKPETPWMREVIRIIKILCKNRRRKDPLWHWEETDYNAARLRAYFRQVSGIADASPHKLRHLRGTRLARTELGLASAALGSKRRVDQRAVDAAFKDALTTVGKLLGHVKGIGGAQTTVWTTACKNYVDIVVMTDFYSQFKDLGVRVPAWLAKLRG